MGDHHDQKNVKLEDKLKKSKWKATKKMTSNILKNVSKLVLSPSIKAEQSNLSGTLVQ